MIWILFKLVSSIELKTKIQKYAHALHASTMHETNSVKKINLIERENTLSIIGAAHAWYKMAIQCSHTILELHVQITMLVQR